MRRTRFINGIRSRASSLSTATSADGTDTISNAEYLKFNDQLVHVAPKTDFNGDHKSDILLQDGRTGACYIWEMNGLSVRVDKSNYLVLNGAPGYGAVMKGTGDFDGDGKSDILLLDANRDCYVWLMNGLNVTQGAKVCWTLPNDGWTVAGTGDFNGDGKSDILLQNANDGTCYIWQLNGTSQLVGNGYVGWTPGKEWQVASSGDFNGDEKGDILLQNVVDGACYVWEMDGLQRLNGKSSGYVGWTPPNAGWKVAGTGDFNGDGKSDILLQDGASGSCYIWEMDGLNARVDKSNYLVLNGAPGYGAVVKGTGDFNGDGKSDILLEDANRDCFVWLMDGLNVTAGAKVCWTLPNEGWAVAGTADFNGDGKTDILLRDGSAGQCYVWEMDGLKLLTDTSYGYVGGTPPNADWHAMA